MDQRKRGGELFPKVGLAHLPTPVEKLPRLSRLLSGPEILIKRDDQTGLAFGGNKTRKLEYLMADAMDQGADLVLSTGAAQSNHCRQTAAAAARCGLECTLVLVGPEPEKPSANLFLDRLLGARIVWTDPVRRDRDLEEAYHETEKAGKKPYLIPYGGSSGVGAFAYHQAYHELIDQMASELPDWIVFASSSGGTQAGLISGAVGRGKPKILGISVDESESQLQLNVMAILLEMQGMMNTDLPLAVDDILVNADYTGKGYGMMTDLDQEAIHLFARYEGILLDPVYTGRAGAGLIDLIRKGFFTAGERILFWHTGGTPALFADRYLPEII